MNSELIRLKFFEDYIVKWIYLLVKSVHRQLFVSRFFKNHTDLNQILVSPLI